MSDVDLTRLAYQHLIGFQPNLPTDIWRHICDELPLHVIFRLYIASRPWRHSVFSFISQIDGSYFHPEQDFSHRVLRVVSKRCKDLKMLVSVTISNPNIHSSKVNPLIRLAELPNVQTLNLSSCAYLDSISPIRTITTLRSLSLAGCNNVMREDSSWLSKLTNLTHFDISRTLHPPSSHFMSALQDHTRLRSLVMNYSGFIPEKLWLLTQLTKLQLRWSGGSTQYANFAALTNLEELDVTSFLVKDHIRGISALSNLKVLNLSIARLTTDLISWLPNLTRLEEISLATTHVTSVWTGELLLRCPRLRTIDLSHTHVDNEIFDYLVRCENLQSVVITGSLIRMDLLSASTFVALERVQVLDHSNDVW